MMLMGLLINDTTLPATHPDTNIEDRSPGTKAPPFEESRSLDRIFSNKKKLVDCIAPLVTSGGNIPRYSCRMNARSTFWLDTLPT
mmetsp:Transcript_77891/g.152906  ORF Transcript_77891/g.152906 Transcript_77891/m.152906 type:complete len:85 (+) Transcript_77891:677-931(+)